MEENRFYSHTDANSDLYKKFFYISQKALVSAFSNPHNYAEVYVTPDGGWFFDLCVI